MLTFFEWMVLPTGRSGDLVSGVPGFALGILAPIFAVKTERKDRNLTTSAWVVKVTYEKLCYG